MPIRVAIRADAAAEIGTGHVRRCLALAQGLREAGAEVWLVCRPLDAASLAVVQGSDTPVLWLPAAPGSAPLDASDLPPHAAWARIAQEEDAAQVAALLRPLGVQWVCVDHYAFDARWHAAMRAALGCRIAVIDDLADRAIDAEVLLDQNWAEDHARKYAGRLVRGTGTRILAGPRHALLAPAYRTAASYVFHPQVRSIGVFMGGTDPGGASARVLAACAQAGFDGAVEVVSTSSNPHLVALRQACAQRRRTTLTLDAPDLAAFLVRHDLQVGGGGGATWERCCLGAPSIAVMLADNQRSVVPALERMGVLEQARLDAPTSDPQSLPAVLLALLHDSQRRRQLAEAGPALVDGRGAQRVAVCLLAQSASVRGATMDDAPLLHAWRNHPDVRRVSHDPSQIPLAAHLRWMESVLADPARLLLVAHIGSLPVGCVRFDQRNDVIAGLTRNPRGDETNHEVSIYLDPALHHLGLGQPVLRAAEQALAARHEGPLTVHASVLPDNAASRRLFEGAGYEGGPLSFTRRLPARSPGQNGAP
ncbi:UDP-2,4-diacetamido-2,4,6-trideoxy-beta-L-altropyranose hydrolase [Ramlibacter sp.]|uniref:UDP-2,4-diacetamido-2,4, 6-trideoxy-beta-L-altropyranose hydrolase n=1 Tax=Ramlibacter sp. TaxID=1917967 RepID=UPI00262DCFD2|nr:UDP-2,4-diacetamido-2,4,6-trideoxy-beta-L-altropyranose hydrolase [Ramlibacter sp.]MDB5958290.1 UDP-2,4-diacetamido-2,4, 6-trideoxy-beta-L-altropyranose hydrolase [Ramlibacter sp.]